MGGWCVGSVDFTSELASNLDHVGYGIRIVGDVFHPVIQWNERPKNRKSVGDFRRIALVANTVEVFAGRGVSSRPTLVSSSISIR